MKLISIVVPVYNEEENIEHFYEEICKTMQPLGYDFELVFVDDGSKDSSILILDHLSQRDDRVKPLYLVRNFGHQIALTCGLDHAKGEAVITMDGDMQHPPTFIPILIEKWEDGYEVVQTVRKTTEGVSWFKNKTSALYYKLINKISKVKIQPGGSDFRLMDRRVVESFKLYKERARFIRGMIGAIGYKQIQLEFVAPKRFAGTSKFSLNKMLHFALDGITAYSKMPLRFAFYLGIIFGLFSILLTGHVMYIKWFTDEAVPGWATLSVSISLLGGIQLMGLGIIGEYVGRIFEEVKQRPLYFVREKPNILDINEKNKEKKK
ncbi:glycosyltransferase family 2 protein [Anaerosinus gibii]|uniref:Glycosyltransferase family 2 protein n=1 Tax=Selenobaculum gibii TaxID=3054208 RepID=A0A9Y2EUA2_9FIRM|nr:glycosyltransferase family 2 protein [Selenobaculum gbiensis]WIW71450.1 glycosyltransferase family 2 protein [Selenobaculum gbiensis]